jgi:phosphoesterase RecJ-like protein
MMQNFKVLQELLQQPRRIVITAHANPDGDAIGSSLGLFHYLKQFQHRITVIMPTEIPEFLNWMPDFNQILVYEHTKRISNQLLAEADIIFSLDYNNTSRIERMAGALESSEAYKVMIDHHLYPSDFCHAILSDTTASSACQLVYEWIVEMGGEQEMTPECLNSLYVGILTDTGGFRHATSPRLFRIVASMLERGVDNNKMTDLVFNAYTVKSFNLLAYCISDRLELLDDCNTGIISLSKEDHRKYNIKRGDLEGVVNFILKIRSIRCAALITERNDIVKLSTRSKGDFSVQALCSTHFNGGGHKNASGGASKLPFEEVIQKFKDLVRGEYKEELIK